MDANTESSESVIVKRGNRVIGKYLSNFIPPHTPNAMVIPIWKAIAENFP